jgi:hypothetical protein
MGICWAYREESSPVPAIRATSFKHKAKSDSLVGIPNSCPIYKIWDVFLLLGWDRRPTCARLCPPVPACAILINNLQQPNTDHVPYSRIRILHNRLSQHNQCLVIIIKRAGASIHVGFVQLNVVQGIYFKANPLSFFC